MLRMLFTLSAIALTLGGGVLLGVNAERAGWLPEGLSPLILSEPQLSEQSGSASSRDPEALTADVSRTETAAQVEHNENVTLVPELDLGVLVVPRRESLPAHDNEDILLDGGIRLGAATVFEAEVQAVQPELEAALESEAREDVGVADTAQPEAQPEAQPNTAQSQRRTSRAQTRAAQRNSRPARSARATPPAPVGPRLHPNAGLHTLMTAQRMIRSGVPITGSCFRYISTVFERAGHNHWRRRQVVYRGERDDRTFANLSTIRPGDWLYIVRYPDQTPVGTHSVLFVRWEDRGSGRARVISHPGSGRAHPGAERTYDVSRTYRIIRPI